MAYWISGYCGDIICSNCNTIIGDEYFYMFRHTPESMSCYDYCPCCGSNMEYMEDEGTHDEKDLELRYKTEDEEL